MWVLFWAPMCSAEVGSFATVEEGGERVPRDSKLSVPSPSQEWAATWGTQG